MPSATTPAETQLLADIHAAHRSSVGGLDAGYMSPERRATAAGLIARGLVVRNEGTIVVRFGLTDAGRALVEARSSALAPDTKLRIEDLDDGTVHETTWAEFARDNDEELLSELRRAGCALAGGGAAPTIKVSLALDLPALTLRFNGVCEERGITRWSLYEERNPREQPHLRHQVHAWIPGLDRKSLVGCGVDAAGALTDAIESLDHIIAEERAMQAEGHR